MNDKTTDVLFRSILRRAGLQLDESEQEERQLRSEESLPSAQIIRFPTRDERIQAKIPGYLQVFRAIRIEDGEALDPVSQQGKSTAQILSFPCSQKLATSPGIALDPAFRVWCHQQNDFAVHLGL